MSNNKQKSNIFQENVRERYSIVDTRKEIWIFCKSYGNNILESFIEWSKTMQISAQFIFDFILLI